MLCSGNDAWGAGTKKRAETNRPADRLTQQGKQDRGSGISGKIEV